MNNNMNEDVKTNNNETKGLMFSVVGVLTLLVAIIGATYAYFQATANVNNVIKGSVASAGLDLSIKKVGVATSDAGFANDKLIPQKGAAINSAIGKKCKDGNGNTVCQVYEITVKNLGTSAVKVNGKISFQNISSMANLKWAKSSTKLSGFSGQTKALTTNQNLASSVNLTSQNASSTIYVAIWIEETGSVQTDSGTFNATVTFNSSDGSGGVTSTITS